MIQSMTAFARGDSVNDKGSLSWEIRTVNHRYLDTALRLPEGFRSQENDLKEIVRQHLSRGKVDATLRFDPEAAETVAAINLDQQLIKNLIAAQGEIQSLSGSASNLSVSEILNWPIFRLRKDRKRWIREHHLSHPRPWRNMQVHI